MRLNPRVMTLFVIALLAPVGSRFVIRGFPSIHRAELLIYDWHARSLPPVPRDPRIVLVGMDQESLAHLPLERPSYPLPRTIHARVVQQLHAAGARIIAFDVTFSRSIPMDDRTFAAALAASRPVLCGTEPHVTIADGTETVTFTPPTEALRPYLTASSLLAPLMLGKVRWFMPATVDANTLERYTHLSVALAEAVGGNAASAPPGGDGEILIRFAGPPNTFPPIPLYQVFDGSWQQRFGPDFFRGKAVLLGIIDPLVDRPLTPVGDMQGVEVLAQAAQMVLQGNWIGHWSEAANFGTAAVLCLMLAACIWRLGVRWALLSFAIEGAVWVVAAHEIFVTRQVWADTMDPIAALALTLSVSSVYEAGRVRRVFRRFLPSHVAEHMLQAHAQDAPASREVEATIVFCDVRSSTLLAETVPSDRMEALMRRYFTAGEDAAHRLGTELDKFVGDEIMLYFEARPGEEGHAVRAIRWAFEIHKACEEITASGIAGTIGFRVGVGICTGVVRVGTVGARQRIQHTVMGDAVNTASRLQGLTKELQQPTLVGEATWQQAAERVDGTLVGEVPIRGKTQPMKLYAPARIR